MLKEKDYEKVSVGVSRAYERMVFAVKKDIERRIKSTGEMTGTAIHQLDILTEAGQLRTDLVKSIALTNDVSMREARKKYLNAIKTGIQRDNGIYLNNGFTKEKLEISKEMKQLLNEWIKREEVTIANLSMTTAVTGQEYFIKEMNEAVLKVSSGAMTKDEAIKQSLNNLKTYVPTIKYPSGRKVNVKSAMKMIMTTSMGQVYGELQIGRARELNQDLMEISAHADARATHAEWQGKIVSLSGRDKRYLTLEDIGYKRKDGFLGINCYHSWSPYFEGGERTYTDEKLKEMKINIANKESEGKSVNNEKYLKKIGIIIDEADTEEVRDLFKRFAKNKVEYIKPKKAWIKRSEDKIIEKLSGVDNTGGSCVSQALAYIGNKIGYKVKDYRGRKSRKIFAQSRDALLSASGKAYTKISHKKHDELYKKLKESEELKEGKEYLLLTARHASIIKKNDNTLNYLELQGGKEYDGYRELTAKMFRKRFGYNKIYKNDNYQYNRDIYGYIIDPEDFKKSKDFGKLLGFLNTER